MENHAVHDTVHIVVHYRPSRSYKAKLPYFDDFVVQSDHRTNNCACA